MDWIAYVAGAAWLILSLPAALIIGAVIRTADEPRGWDQ